MRNPISRRSFLRTMTAAAGAFTVCATARGSGMFDFPRYVDERTGATVHMLTGGSARDWVVYQTHPMWTPDMGRLLFHTERFGPASLATVDMTSGAIAPAVEGGAGTAVLARRDDRLYYLRDRDVMVTRAATDAEPRVVAPLPTFAQTVEGGFSLDAREDMLYAGAVLETDQRWALLALHLESGSWQKRADLDFRIGHVQANPVRPGVVMFCWETGGDAPQRMWVIDAESDEPRPFYKETYDEWVTHEAWWGGDRAIFTVWPYDEERTRQPHGILSVDLATGAPTVHSQYRAWHTQGSPDGRWAVGDDFDRNLWLVRIDTGERRLLTQGHNGEGFQTHPHASFTPDGKGIVFSSSRNGAEDIFLVDVPEWESLPPLEG